MTTTRTLRLDQLVDAAGATVEIRVQADGTVAESWFAMDGLPRIEPLLVGRPVVDVPGIVERVCGICPVAHHLAGVQALEALAGTPPLTPTADSLRRLLHHGAVLQTHAQRLAGVDASQARELGGFAGAVVAAAGGDSHFPRCAVPGGVLAPLPVARRDELLGEVGRARVVALELLGQVEAACSPDVAMPTYAGHDIALVDATGALDLYGDRLRAVGADGSITVDGAEATDWPDLVAESRPGSPTPRPYLRSPGPGAGGYRVGPVAQLRAPVRLPTPLAEAARQRWVGAGVGGEGGAAWARAVVTLHVVEAIEELLRRPRLVAGPVLVTGGGPPRSQASGWVDGARGLLVHTYRTDGSGALSAATITTPTAQNEAWLAGVLTHLVHEDGPIDPGGVPPERLRAPLEAAVRMADPCLPCTSQPSGRMGVRVRVTDAREATLASWLLEPATTDPTSDATAVTREGC
ncbi:Ni/Fe hydrogenase subunit alpha [soil metagenome]